MRLQKYLAQAGVASRRGAEALIAEGRVSINGQTVTGQGVRIDPEVDVVRVDGQSVRRSLTRWIALHKPPGYVSTRHDPQGRRTIYDLLPREMGALFYVGRLDADSEGLLLLTNDGDGAHRLLHPRFQVPREYEAEVAGAPSREVLQRLLAGVQLEDGWARATSAETLARGRIRLTLREGRKREVRRMLAAVGHPVRRLLRTRYGPVRLSDLEPGRWRYLAAEEIAALRAEQVDPENAEPN